MYIYFLREASVGCFRFVGVEEHMSYGVFIRPISKKKCINK